MTINTEIRTRLREFNIPVKDGIHYLLGVYFGEVSEVFPEMLKKRIMASKIYEPESSGTLKWNVPLFDEQVTGFEWVTDWMDLFGDINKDRRGVKSYVMARMKKFFVEHPSIRKEQIMEATRMYIQNVDNPKYLKSSHKFIMEGKGEERYSMLLEWVQKLENWNNVTGQRTGLDNTIQ